jgi:hypothetical protein
MPRGLADREEHDRLMVNLQPPPDSPPSQPDEAPYSACPTCGLDGEGFARRARGILRGHYLCPAGHIWQVKWMRANDGGHAA